MTTPALLAAVIACCMGINALAAEQHTTSVAKHTALFAGGCFWCMEAAFEKVEGVDEVISGYTGGHVERPSYEQVSKGSTGHYETVQVIYNPNQVTYEQLLETFWQNIDPHDDTGQFCDKGDQYRAAIFFSNTHQQQAAEASKRALESSGSLSEPVVTQILPARRFWSAEDYHQDYYQEHSIRYRYYRTLCGRDRRLNQIWNEVNLKAVLADKN